MIWKSESSTGVSGMTAGPSRVQADVQSRGRVTTGTVEKPVGREQNRSAEQDGLLL